MALLLRLSITGRVSIRRIISRKNARNSLFCSVKDLEMVVLRMSEGFDGLNKVVKESKTASFKGEVEENTMRIRVMQSGLSVEIPELFFRELSFDIYRDDIIFKDPINVFAPIDNYKSILWSLRFHGRIFFRALWIDIVSVRQPLENTIMVRWIVHGIPRTPWESRSRFNGTSEYRVDRDGKIYEHKVHNIAPNGPKINPCNGATPSINYLPFFHSKPDLLQSRLNFASSFDRIN